MYGMKTKWMGAALLAALIGATGCSKNEDGGDGGDGGGGSNASKLESYAMTPEWINYATAVSSELLDACGLRGTVRRGFRTKTGNGSAATFSAKIRLSARTVTPST